MSAQSQQPKSAKKKWNAGRVRFAYAMNARKRLDDMTPEEREAHEAAKRERAEARRARRAERTARAHAEIAEWVGALPVMGDLPVHARERAAEQSEANTRGIVVVDLPRPNGARLVVLLREWNGELRIHSMLLFVDTQGRAIRSLGSTIYLRDVTDDGEVVLSLRELDATIAGLASLRERLASRDPALIAQIADMRAAREQWQREHAPSGNRGPR